jgi:hypothetical protein
MIAKTAPAPVHFLDIDRKIPAMGLIADQLKSGDVTYWPLEETLAEETLAERVKNLASRDVKQLMKPPQGWVKFAELVNRLGKDPVSLEASTWAVDSATMLVPHLMNSILFYAQATAGMSPREWGYFLRMWAETITTLRDLAITHDKNLIMTVHERPNEVPRPTTKVLYEKDAQGNKQRVYQGQLDMKIGPSIEGQFGLLMPSYFEEVYALRVEMVNNKPKWFCRIKPDGLRDLRTSFDIGLEECEPDFRKIWKKGG